MQSLKHSSVVSFIGEEGLGFVNHRIKAMGSPCEFKFYIDPLKAEEILQDAISLLQKLENKYSRYRSDSVISEINASAGKSQHIQVDSETAKLFDYAAMLFSQSDGLFDITSGILRNVWDFRSGKLPDTESICRLLPLIGWQQVSWDGGSISLPQVGMEIDFGGFVKEYAADQIVQFLQNHGVEFGLVNLGGDIRVIGPHPDQSPWIVGIQHPRIAEKAIVSIPLMKGAIATSGDYERFMVVNGRRYSHLLNPTTGWPASSPFSSVTIFADQCVVAGSFSTISFLKSAAEQDWLDNSGADFLIVNQAMQLRGNLTPHSIIHSI